MISWPSVPTGQSQYEIYLDDLTPYTVIASRHVNLTGSLHGYHTANGLAHLTQFLPFHLYVLPFSEKDYSRTAKTLTSDNGATFLPKLRL